MEEPPEQKPEQKPHSDGTRWESEVPIPQPEPDDVSDTEGRGELGSEAETRAEDVVELRQVCCLIISRPSEYLFLVLMRRAQLPSRRSYRSLSFVVLRPLTTIKVRITVRTLRKKREKSPQR